jgi:hypothetical protein
MFRSYDARHDLEESHGLTPQIDCIDPTLRGIGIHFVAPLEEYICRVWVDNSIIRDLESSHNWDLLLLLSFNQTAYQSWHQLHSLQAALQVQSHFPN